MMGNVKNAEQIQVPADVRRHESCVSPDGQRVAFEVNGQTGSITLFVAKADGGKVLVSQKKWG